MADRITMRKWFWVWDFEKEERWLNEMAMQGWALVGVGFCTYHFEKCEPGAYTIRLEMHQRDEAYVSFMEETGAEYLGRMVMWIYFRKKSVLGQFDLFSDLDSKIAYLKRIYRTLGLIGVLNLGIGLMNSFNSSHFGWVNLLCCALLMYACGIFKGKIDYLENERSLRE